MMTRSGFILAAVLIVAACSDGASEDDAGSVAESLAIPVAETPDSPPSNGSAGASTVREPVEEVSLDRDTFILCPVIADHAGELAAIVGLDMDPERGVEETSANECNIMGANPGDFARVERGSSFDGTVDGYVAGFQGDEIIKTRAMELGRTAVYVTDGYQPHVVFKLGERLIIDVTARVEKPDMTADPGYEAMIAFAGRVRELLVEANSG